MDKVIPSTSFSPVFRTKMINPRPPRVLSMVIFGIGDVSIGNDELVEK
jgi:hypothetical protein